MANMRRNDWKQFGCISVLIRKRSDVVDAAQRVIQLLDDLDDEVMFTVEWVELRGKDDVLTTVEVWNGDEWTTATEIN